uniref:Uncharacterized protein n=1 Tax=Meloidogyne hapla TaxID=6305 RepID=A0A1I8BT87_MELHA
MNSAPAAIEFYKFLEKFPFDFESKIKSPGIQKFNPHAIENYIITVLRYSEITTSNPEQIFQETGKFFNKKEQINEFIKFLETIGELKFTAISNDLFNIFEMHGIQEGEKRSQVTLTLYE